jgi:hypothetical protein
MNREYSDLMQRAAHRLLITAVLLQAASAAPGGATDWPADSGVEIGRMGEPGGLPGGFEPSGAVWHAGRNRLIVVDDGGIVCELNPAGGLVSWDLGGDLEAVTLADPAGSIVFVGVENPDGVVEFDLATGAPTGNAWDLTPWLQGPGNQGLEALTFVDGLFYAGLQDNGDLFIFDLQAGGSVQHLGTRASHDGRDDLSGMHYDACTGVLYAIHDSHDVIVETLADGTFLREYDLAGDNQEGVALIGESGDSTTTLFIAEDAGEVWQYGGYPVDPCSPSVGAAIGNEAAPSPAAGIRGCTPNPTRGGSWIRYDLPRASEVVLGIHSASGRMVRTLEDGTLPGGRHRSRWDGRNDAGRPVGAGVYFCRLRADGTTSARRIIVLP